MREKYESLSLVVLKDLAKARGLKGISTMKKGELIDRMLQEDEREKETAPKAKTVYTARTASGQEGRKHTPKQRREEHLSHTEEHNSPEHGENVHASQEQTYKVQEDNDSAAIKEDIVSLDSGNTASGILEVMADGFGFIRCENYLPGEHDVYVAPSQIRRFNLKTGDIVCGNTKVKSEREKFSALLYVTSVNGYHPSEAQKRTNFEDLTPIFPNVRLRMERPGGSVVNKYSAFGMLSRVYLTYAGYSSNPNSATRNQDYLDLAKKAALKVIENRNFELMTDYADLFMIDKNNNSETLFALQWVSNGTYGECNTIQDYFACESAITGNDRAWGGYVFAQPDVIWEYEKGDKRRQPTWMAYGDHYPEIQKANGGYTCEKKASGTVSGIYCKKYVCGSSKDNAKITSGSTPINTYMLRLAEVYLIYAEAILGNNPSTDDADAMEYFNKVRKRAGLEPQNSITYEDIRRERRLELCLEGQYWYDLVRRAYYKQQEVLNYITGQDRGTAIPVVWDADTQTLKRDEDSDETKRAIGDVDSSIFLLPYPESETVQNPLLKADPMPYAFKEDRITDLFN